MRANREQNHLQGSVRAIHARTVTLVERDGETVEELQSTRTITWNTTGHRVEETNQYRSDGALICKSRHTYDSTGNLTELVAYNTDGSVALKKAYAYDSTGRLIEEKNYSADGSLMGNCSAHAMAGTANREPSNHAAQRETISFLNSPTRMARLEFYRE